MANLMSDTVTRPTPGMRAAMAQAEVGDDVFGADPTVNALQERIAAMFGHEAALFVPSGTMANQVALQTLVKPGEELLCDADAHILTYEGGAGAAYGGWTSRTWSPVGAEIDPHVVASMVRVPGFHQVPTKVIAVEQTHNLAAGAIIPLSTLEDLRSIANSVGASLHCDGARLWNAHVATGIPLRTYGALFDSICVCLSKGLGAPVGSVVIGSSARMVQAREVRRRLGGGMRQAGILAAAGLYALDHHIDRLAEDHARAKRIAEAVGARWGGTNLVYVECEDANALMESLAAQDIFTVAMGPKLLRLITHLDVDDAAVDRVINVLKKLLGAQ